MPGASISLNPNPMVHGLRAPAFGFLLGPSDTLDEAFRNPETARADPKPYTAAASVKDFTFVPLTFVA